jgi:DNA polymerase-3 subunit delta
MIIKNFEIDKFKKSNSNLHLIYGINEGIKQDLINNIYLEGYKGDIFKYEEHEVLNNIDQFISNLLTKSLFGNKKIIIISRATDKLCTLINDLLDREIVETKIIIKSSSLEKKSKLRNLFEKEDQLICTPVYEDDTRSLNYVIQNFLKVNNFSLSQEIKNILIERSKGDRINLKNELSKLKNLSLSKNKISVEDVNKLSNLAENYSVFELSDNYLAKNSKKVSNILNENNYSSEDCILIIRTILNKSKRLLKIRNEIDKNTNIDQAISSFKPPIFWKEKDIVKKQAQSWSTSEVKEIIFKINDLEALVKKNNTNSMLFVSNFVSNY